MKEAIGTKNQWKPEYYNQTASFVAKYGKGLFPLLRAKENECILDLGCGTGKHAHEIALAGASVIGIDASQHMIKKAKESYPHLEFRTGNGEDFQLERKVDAVFSNAALHWMKRPERVISSVNRCLKTGGRFVGEMGCKGNVASIIQALYQALEEYGIEKKEIYNPWYFPSVGEYTTLLEQGGFEVCYVSSFVRPTELVKENEGIEGWIANFARDFLAPVDESVQGEVVKRVESIAREHLYENEKWIADYKRLRFLAIKK
ncbi:class I SAM-dependent methyltransferase [Priestia endophytica]|uniref:class I SAM-dependent methyltransferase n=1 Tax=Priestia endophytica TaxID=135735 RepID=UPI0020404628|nr:class I SAM-dependent methyltransferase [Priestia endophytica]MCM3537224.1 class I SAM-dependent methyltransferase [Priestia endophytica]